MKSRKFERFGRYLILDHLVDGGMAKICRARFLGEQADKIVAIKMIQSQYSKDENFKTMFMNEIKVTFSLDHPNIAQTFDYGEVGGQLYTSMEYVDGHNMKQFLNQLKAKKKSFPIELSVHAISQVCQGLHYAHNFTDKLTGRPLNIIHRDISPHNIMITYDGAVKIIDFGIAKAETNSDATQAGTIKGKFSYLAPEYLEGLTLDHTYDQFGVGVTLWELLCGRKLFQAANDLAILKLIQKCEVPAPSSLNPHIPKTLDHIVLKSLAKARTDRFENMEQMNRSLVRFLYSEYPEFNATDLGYFTKELFKEDFAKDRRRFVEYGKIDISSYYQDFQNEISSHKKTTEKTRTNLYFRKKNRQEINLDLGEKKEDIDIEATRTQMPRPERQEKSGFEKKRRGTQTNVRLGRATQKTPHKSSVSKILLLILVGLVVFQLDFIKEKFQQLFLKNPMIQDQSNQGVKTEQGTLFLKGYDPFMDIYLEDQLVSYSGAGLKLDFDKEVILRVEKQNHRTFIRTIMLTSDQPSQTVTIPTLGRVSYGELESSPQYIEGSVLSIDVDGEIREFTIPFSGVKLPTGTYKAVVRNPILNIEKNLEIKIEKNKKNLLP